tara:strand:+ start:4797 stop:5117 length:321 start_codon:yes stop_codon:yes gene_type:complete
MFKKLLIIILLFLQLSCQSIKDGLSGKKYESSDEFLVIKKNPLVLPPDFNSLPKPKDQEKLTRTETIENEIEDVINSIKSGNMSGKKKISSESKSTEDFVIDKIKN